MKIDWRSKLTSRKFWMALIGFITAMLVVIEASDLTIQQVAAMIGALSTLIAYIVGEGLIDAARSKQSDMKSELGFIDEGFVDEYADSEGEDI
jgi:hypothetical protein